MRSQFLLVLLALAWAVPLSFASGSATWFLSTDASDAGLAMHRGFEQGGPVVVIPANAVRLWVSDENASGVASLANKSFLLRLQYNGGGAMVQAAFGFERKLGDFEACAFAGVPQDTLALLPPSVSSFAQRSERLVQFNLDANCVAQPGDRLGLRFIPASDMFVYTTTSTDVLGTQRSGTTLMGDATVVG